MPKSATTSDSAAASRSKLDGLRSWTTMGTACSSTTARAICAPSSNARASSSRWPGATWSTSARL
eukprot:4831902-Prymnesium_polylepis.1